ACRVCEGRTPGTSGGDEFVQRSALVPSATTPPQARQSSSSARLAVPRGECLRSALFCTVAAPMLEMYRFDDARCRRHHRRQAIWILSDYLAACRSNAKTEPPPPGVLEIPT